MTNWRWRCWPGWHANPAARDQIERACASDDVVVRIAPVQSPEQVMWSEAVDESHLIVTIMALSDGVEAIQAVSELTHKHHLNIDFVRRLTKAGERFFGCPESPGSASKCV